MVLAKRIVWEPEILPGGLWISLDMQFAAKCARHQTDREHIQKMAVAIWRELGEKGNPPSGYLDIHEGILPRGIYIVRPALALAWTSLSIDFRSELPLVYHGETNVVSAQHMLLKSFSLWVKAAKAQVR